MKETSLIQLLKSLSHVEMRKLDKFLRSPYFMEGKNISSGIIYKYFEILKRHHPHFNDKEISDEKIYSRLYSKGKNNVKIMRKLNSDLLKLIENFLSHMEFEKNGTEFRQNLLHQLADRKIEKIFNRRFNEMLKYLETLDKDEDYFYEVYNTWNNYWTNYFLSKIVYKLEESLKHINSFFIYVIIGSLSIYLWGLSYFSNFLRIANVEHEFYLYSEILNHVKKNYSKYKDIPQILIHYNLICLIVYKQEEYFYELKSLKNKYISSLSNKDRYNLFIMMSNYCQLMISHQYAKYREERFDLDNEFLQSNLISWVGGLHFFHFLSILKNAIKLRKFNWAGKKIETLRYQIEPKYRDFAINYVNSLIFFEKKEYNKSLELLGALKTEYSHQKQHVCNLMLQIYFENGEDETAFSLIDTSRHFIHRDKHLTKNFKESSLSFLKFTEKLIKLRGKPSVETTEMLKKEMAKQPGMENKDWLVEKADELLK
ncbi:MAG: hypothetical protein L0Y79_08390 [Chlorobi bacterium]|nr:hypothetical protein [Chlorobiota bacterium]